MKNDWLVPAVILFLIILCLGCVCVVFASMAGLIIWGEQLGGNITPQLFGPPTPTPVVMRPTLQRTPGSSIEALPEEIPTDTLETLKNIEVPVNDLLDLAQRLEGKQGIPRTLAPPGVSLVTGAEQTFWVTNMDTNENFQVDATLQFVTDHVNFWVQDEVPFDEGNLRELAETFEYEIYPRTRDFFGSEWTPGVDGDPHLYILYVQGVGFSLAGYFSSIDEYHPLAHEYSNAHEMLIMNADNVALDEEYAYSVLAHEFQHMILWNRDRNESSWMNEGLSELSSFLNGYDTGGFDFSYTNDPDLQVNDWPNDRSQTGPHYGAAFLFLTYFLDRFGEKVIQALVLDASNDLSSMDAVLKSFDARDLLTGDPIGADEVFLDWVLTSYLNDPQVGDGRYAYHNYPNAPQAEETETISTCPHEFLTSDVHQYGVDYIRITCDGDYTLRFEGGVQVALLPADAHSVKYAFWSNKGDESDMTLTRVFDFSDQQGELTLTYWTWYDLEEDYDYVYLESSLDGERWQILTTLSGTAEDPTGNSYGWGYNGSSAGWIQESVDLSQFAGQKIYLRFEYVTDAAVNGEGMLLDDVAIPQIGYKTDFEQDDGGWEAAGWARVQNVLPQSYQLALIESGDRTSVTYITLKPDNSVEIPLSIGGEVEEVVLVVAGTTRYTRQKTAYRVEIVR